MPDTLVALGHQFGDTTVLPGLGETNIGRVVYASYQAPGNAVRLNLTTMFPLVISDDEGRPRLAATRNLPILVTDNSLSSGVLAHLEITEEGLVLVDSVTGIFGVGTEPKEAVEDFLAALREHAAVLAAEERLSVGLQEQLAYLQRHLAS
jgi:hypothetical protein